MRVCRHHHPLVPPMLMVALAAGLGLLALRGTPGPFVAWVLMGAAAGYSLSGSV